MSPRLFRRLLSARLLHIAGVPATLALLALTSCDGAAEKRIECIDWDSQLGACLSREEALQELQLDQGCANVHHSVDSDATLENGQCCYEVTITDECCYGNNCPVEGRPLVLEGEMLLAPAVRRATGWPSDLPAPAAGAAEPTDAERAHLAEAWLRAARQEHASVASFARFSLELLAFGAPPALVAAAHAAALDEIGHARACFGLASRLAGEPIGPGPLPLPAALPVTRDLAELAAAVVEEGCVGETLAALFASEQRAAASDPEVCAALEAIAKEEARHAELGWAAVRWALSEGGERVRRAAEKAFLRAAARAMAGADDAPSPGLRPEVLAAHGRLPMAVYNQVVSRGLAEVVFPCARAMGVLAPAAAPAEAAVHSAA